MSSRTVLKQSVLDLIRGDAELLAKVCRAIDNDTPPTPTYALRLVRDNDARLTMRDVLRVIVEYKINKGEDCEDADLYEEIQLETVNQ